MPDLHRNPGHMIVAVLWPSFLVALAAEFVFFALVDPADLPLLGVSRPLPRAVVYTFGFFAFWTIGSVASALALYFGRPLPRHHEARQTGAEAPRTSDHRPS
jgi:hypothetical protein